jgi:hypothetical protein
MIVSRQMVLKLGSGLQLNWRARFISNVGQPNLSLARLHDRATFV